MMHTASFEASNVAQTYLQSLPSGIDNKPPYRGYDAAARSRPARKSSVIISTTTLHVEEICYFNRERERKEGRGEEEMM